MTDKPLSTSPAPVMGADGDPSGLEHALQSALAPPPLPPGFRAALERRIAREQAEDLASRQRALSAEHAQAMARLRAGRLSLRYDTLLTIVAGAFTIGAAASVAVPSLAHWMGSDVPTLVTLAASVGALALAVAVVLRGSGWRSRESVDI